MVKVITGIDGPAVILSAETAYWLERLCKVSALRQRLRDGQHQQVSQELLDLRRVAMTFDPARLSPETKDESPQTKAVQDWDRWLSAVEVADLLTLTDAAVRLACRDGRLEGERVGGRWRISRQAVHDFEQKRATGGEVA